MFVHVCCTLLYHGNQVTLALLDSSIAVESARETNLPFIKKKKKIISIKSWMHPFLDNLEDHLNWFHAWGAVLHIKGSSVKGKALSRSKNSMMKGMV